MPLDCLILLSLLYIYIYILGCIKSILNFLKDFGLVWFLCLIPYQSSWVIECQVHPCRRTVVVLFDLQLVEDKGIHTLFKGISPKVNIIVQLTYFEATVQHFSN